MINEKGILKLVDFGIFSNFLGFCVKIKENYESAYCGTLHAMAPEFFIKPIAYS